MKRKILNLIKSDLIAYCKHYKKKISWKAFIYFLCIILNLECQ